MRKALALAAGAALVAAASIPARGAAIRISTSNPAPCNVKDHHTGTTDSRQFTAVVDGSDQRVTWRVNGIAGGNNRIGTIDAKGLYTCPDFLPNPNPVTIEAVTGHGASSATLTIARNVVWTSDCKFADFLTTLKGTDQTCTYLVGPPNRQETRVIKYRVPATFRPGNPAAVFFHGNGGGGGTVDTCENHAGFRTKADEMGFIAACPQGISGGEKTKGWMSFWMPPTFGPIGRDADFAWAILEDMTAKLHADPDRRYATGISGGSNFTSSALLVENGSLLAAIAVIEGEPIQWDNVPDRQPASPAPPNAVPNYPVSVFMTVGRSHATNPVMAACDHPRNSKYGVFTQATLDENFVHYTKAFRCATIVPNTKPFCPDGRGTPPSDEVWKAATGCAGNVEVRAYQIVNGAHSWHRGVDLTGDTGIHNPQFIRDFPGAAPPRGKGQMIDVVWEFLSRHRRPAAVRKPAAG